MDIKEFLENHNIRFWTSGKNVSRNHINVQCPFCGDKSNHLGIRIYDLKCNCWKCGPKNIVKVISTICNYSYSETKEVLKSIDKKIIIQEIKKELSHKVLLPKEATKNFPKQHLQYLKERGFKPKKLIKKFDLYANNFEGKYKFRIIIPIYMDNKLVSFTSRDITNKQNPKYKNAKPQESIMEIKKCIFNYDTIKQNSNAIWVEGPLDVMKIGNGCFCFMGIEMTPERILKLSKKKINTLYTIGDNDANLAGEIASKTVSLISSSIAKRIVNIKLKTKKDPGELTLEEVKQLKRDINFKY